jgi:hypothetical protein
LFILTAVHHPVKNCTLNQKLLLPLFLCLYCLSVHAQTDSSKHDKDDETEKCLIFSSGFSFQKQFMGEVGVIYGYVINGSCSPGGLMGWKLASEFNFSGKNFIIGPKIRAELDFALFGTRLSIVDYTDFTYHDIKLLPELGLSLIGSANLFYGYNFSLTNRRIPNIGTHRLSLTVNFNKELWGMWR